MATTVSPKDLKISMSNAPRPAPDTAPKPLAEAFPAGLPRYSIVVPVYNEQENLDPLCRELVQAMAGLTGGFEIVFVNDGSSDGSGDVLRSLRAADARVRVLSLSCNSGQTAALAAGFGAARGAVVITMDADLQNDPADIPSLLERLDGHDAVVGWRGHRNDSWLRRVSSRIGNSVRNALSGDDIIDTGCSLKVFRREALEGIKLYHGMHRFLPTLLRMEGRRVGQVRVNHRPRIAGRSKYNIRNRLVRSFADLLAVRWMKRRTIRTQVTEDR